MWGGVCGAGRGAARLDEEEMNVGLLGDEALVVLGEEELLEEQLRRLHPRGVQGERRAGREEALKPGLELERGQRQMWWSRPRACVASASRARAS